MSDEQKKENAETPANDAPEVVAPETAETTAPASDTAPEETPATPVTDEARENAEKEAAAAQAEEERLAAEEVKDVQVLQPGMTVRVHFTIREGEKTRIQVFQGLIVAMRGKTTATKTITVLKNSFGVGVERIFPLASPLIAKIEVVKIAKVRRSKLFFMRDYRKRLKETLVKAS